MTMEFSTRSRWLLLAICVVLAPLANINGATARLASNDNLPQLSVDALDPYQWSLSEVFAAPGQTIVITNRGVLAHNFTVPEWGVSVELPTLEPVEVVVPDNLQPGEQFSFFCDEPGHQEGGQHGIVVIVEVSEAIANDARNKGATDSHRVIVETRDDFTWVPIAFTIAAGDFIEVRNTGAIEHHFVVDAWGINVTIPSGQIQLIQVPHELLEGEVFLFYCSIPGHRALGMEGTITIAAVSAPNDTPGADTPKRIPGADVHRFVPDASVLGDGWELVRTGNARAVLNVRERVSVTVFPGEGQSATYVGPAGGRIAIVVLPFVSVGIPANQIDDAILNIQLAMMTNWDVDPRSGTTLNQVSPPPGCDVATRQSGVTRTYTLPAGSTVCQLRSAGIAIFVAVEGEYDGTSGATASDRVIAKILQVV